MSTLMLATAGAAVGLASWLWWAVNIKEHDDDDEVYWACFQPTATPVATPHAFVKILERVPEGGRVLDVGIGSGTYIECDKVRDLVRKRKLTIDGVDISTPNVAICQERVRNHKISAHFNAKVQVARAIKETGVYDAILFMESFPCMSKPLFSDILLGVQGLLKPQGVNYLYHNLADPTTVGWLYIAVMRLVKPTIKLFVGIDFGRLTTLAEMDEVLRTTLPGSRPKTEILLAAKTSAANISFSHVRNSWCRLWGTLLMALIKYADTDMEQHLITIPGPFLN